MAAMEEIIARGYQLTNVTEGLYTDHLGPTGSVALSILIVSVFFGLFHYSSESGIISVLALVIGGFFYAVVYAITGELAIPIGFHVAWNFTEGCVYGFPVSGVSFGVTILQTQSVGSELWTGGVFGPEAGPSGIAGHLLAIPLAILWIYWRQGRIRLMAVRK